MMRTEIKQWNPMGSKPVRTFCPVSGYYATLNFALKQFLLGFKAIKHIAMSESSGVKIR